MKNITPKTYAFIDASNLFYGGEKSLGWKIDYLKLFKYLKEKYNVSDIYYFGGVEIHDYKYDYLSNDTVPIEKLKNYIEKLIHQKGKFLDDVRLLLLSRHLQRIKFYLKLQKFGYKLFLKPVKLYYQTDGTTQRKANCDVDMAFYVMKDQDSFKRIVFLSGDGDFLLLLKYLRKIDKKVFILQ